MNNKIEKLGPCKYCHKSSCVAGKRLEGNKAICYVTCQRCGARGPNCESFDEAISKHNNFEVQQLPKVE